jgi:hypothetical protein
MGIYETDIFPISWGILKIEILANQPIVTVRRLSIGA